MSVLMAGHCIIPEPKASFYNNVFTVIIFTHVLILILSLGAWKIRTGLSQCGPRALDFSASLLAHRRSPHGAPLALFALAFGILRLLVFNFHSRIRTDN